MILTVTANPAVDLTYAVPALVPGRVHRVTEVAQRAGGKGINVARVLRSLGEQVTVTGFTGGPNGQWLADEVTASGIGVDLVTALPDVRRTVVVRTPDETTSLWEPGRSPADPEAAERELRRTVARLVGGVRALTVSGSLPPGVSPGLPSALADIAIAEGIPVVLDLDGAALRHAVDAGTAAVLTPNQDEIERLTGTRPEDPEEAARVVRPLVGAGAAAVVATLGEAGAVVVWPGGACVVAPPERVPGNPTGAGDAATAAIARHLARGGPGPGDWVQRTDWAALVADVVATSAASVLRPVAGEIDVAARDRWLAEITPRPLEV